MTRTDSRDSKFLLSVRLRLCHYACLVTERESGTSAPPLCDRTAQIPVTLCRCFHLPGETNHPRHLPLNRPTASHSRSLHLRSLRSANRAQAAFFPLASQS